jgi:hypothetical protein
VSEKAKAVDLFLPPFQYQIGSWRNTAALYSLKLAVIGASPLGNEEEAATQKPAPSWLVQLERKVTGYGCPDEARFPDGLVPSEAKVTSATEAEKSDSPTSTRLVGSGFLWFVSSLPTVAPDGTSPSGSCTSAAGTIPPALCPLNLAVFDTRSVETERSPS